MTIYCSRLTESTRRGLALAEGEARRLNHHWIGTEHLPLGLLREKEGAAACHLYSSRS